MNVKIKKILINILCGLALFGFGCGITTECIYRKAKQNSSGIELTENELNKRIGDLESELEQRIAEVDKLNSQLNTTRDQINDIISITGQLRSTADNAAITSGNITSIIKELRDRIKIYERTIDELDLHCRKLESCLSK